MSKTTICFIAIASLFFSVSYSFIFTKSIIEFTEIKPNVVTRSEKQ
jgi:hypothetical protein